MYKEIFVVPSAILNRLPAGSCPDDLTDPKKIKTLSYRDQVLLLNINALMSRKLRSMFRNPLTPKELKEHFPDAITPQAVETIHTSYTDLLSLKDQCADAERLTVDEIKPLLKVTTSKNTAVLVFTGDLLSMSNNALTKAIASKIVDHFGVDIYSQLGNGTFLRRLCVCRH